MSTQYITLSSQEYPEYMFYDGKCWHLLDDDRRTNYGTVIDSSRMVSYEECGDCQEENPQNTMYVMYEPE